MDLHEAGVLDQFERVIIVSDGGIVLFAGISLIVVGPGHFKVYKTQYWMSCWSEELRASDGIKHIEWNMYFPNLGHNICDGHAGHLKRYA